MSKPKAFVVDGAAAPGGCYSHAVVANGLVFVSSQGPTDPTTGTMPADFKDQVRQCLTNLKTILEGVGSGLDHCVRVTAYLADVSKFDEYNAAYGEFFPNDPPARSTIGCLLDDAEIGLDCVATLRTP